MGVIMNSVWLDMLLKIWLSAGYSWDRCESIISTWDKPKQRIFKQLKDEGCGSCNKLIREIKVNNSRKWDL